MFGLALKLFKKRRASKAVLKVDIEGFQPRLADGLKDTFKVTDKMLLTLFGRHAIFGSMSKGRKQLMNSSHMTFPKSRISLDALLDSDPIEDEKPVYTDDDIERVMVARDVSSSSYISGNHVHAKVLAKNGKWYSVNDLDLREIPFNQVVDRYTSSAVFEDESTPVVVSNVRESPDERALHMLIVATNELKTVIVSNNWLYASEENPQKRKDFRQSSTLLDKLFNWRSLAK